MSDVAVASGYARRLVGWEQRRSDLPIREAIVPVARRLKTSQNAIWCLMFKAPKVITTHLYSALEAAVEREIIREIGALENELAAIRGGSRRLAPGAIDEMEAGIARLKATLAEARQ